MESYAELRKSKTYDHLIASIRSSLLVTFTDEKEHSMYQEDLDDVLNNDDSVRRFLIATNGNLVDAKSKLINSLRWRKENNLRQLNDTSFPAEVYSIGGIFAYQEDRAGRPTLHFRMSHAIVNRDILAMVKSFITYTVWKADRMAGDRGLLVIIDCRGLKPAHLNFSILRTIISIKSNLPLFAAGLLAVEMPFFARIAFSLIENSSVTSKRPYMKALSVDDLKYFVNPDNLPDYLNGFCKVKYSGSSMVPNGCLDCIQYGTMVLGLQVKQCEILAKRMSSLMNAPTNET